MPKKAKTRGCLLKLIGVLLSGLGNTAQGMEDLAPFEAYFLFWKEVRSPRLLKGRFLLRMWNQGLGQLLGGSWP